MDCTIFVCLIFALQATNGEIFRSRENGTTGSLLVPLKLEEFVSPLVYAKPGEKGKGCPDWSAIPVAFDNNFVGSNVYTGKGNPDYSLSCNGDAILYADGFKYSAPSGYCVSIGSIYVLPGCTFYGYHDIFHNFTKIQQNTFISKVPTSMFGNQGTTEGIACATSVQVECVQKYPSCFPTEPWETAASYDNSENDTKVTYSYEYTVGTSWSNEMINGMSISQAVEKELKKALFARFQSWFSDYDWTNVPSDVLEPQHSVEGEIDIEPWDVFELRQTVGYCGGTTIQTDQTQIRFSGESSLFCSQIYVFLPIIVCYFQYLQ